MPTSEFITGDELASKIGLTAGVSQFSNEPWLKFSYLGKIEFIAKKPFRYNISWDNIYKVDAVYGNRTLEINGNNYKVRLVIGKNEGLSKIASDHFKECYYSEWNKLMLPIHEKAPSSFEFSIGVKMPTENWGIGYTDFDLVTRFGCGNGHASWCQEYGRESYSRLLRGGTWKNSDSDVSAASSWPDNMVDEQFGWRPVLELVDE